MMKFLATSPRHSRSPTKGRTKLKAVLICHVVAGKLTDDEIGQMNTANHGIDYLGALDASGALEVLAYPVENGAWNLPMFSLTIP